MSVDIVIDEAALDNLLSSLERIDIAEVLRNVSVLPAPSAEVEVIPGDQPASTAVEPQPAVEEPNVFENLFKWIIPHFIKGY